ncbi:MAG: ferritin family protein [Syntrophomonadaceae bacterium]|nr:ferritin family protein [Syntrophomonadaceae bacterium]
MNANLQKAIQMAIDEEFKSNANYKQLAKDAEDQETRLLFEQLAGEEAMHAKKLSERLKNLKMMG